MGSPHAAGFPVDSKNDMNNLALGALPMAVKKAPEFLAQRFFPGPKDAFALC
jgi:hypothetical protein